MRSVSSVTATVLLAGACLGVQQTAAASWFGKFEANLFHDDNINRADESLDDAKSDTYLELGLTGGRLIPVATAGELSFTATLRGTAHEEFTGLNMVGLILGADYRHKLGLGAYAPWVSVGASVGYEDFNDDNRDALVYGLNARIGKRFESLPNWDFSAALAWERREAGSPDAADVTMMWSGEVFDHSAVSFALNADYVFENSLALLIGYGYRNGDIAASSIWPMADMETPYLNDPVFDMRTYKLDATSHSFTIGLSYPLTDSSSLNASYQHQTVDAEQDMNYDKNLWRLNYLLAF